jgi:hypothetical protein
MSEIDTVEKHLETLAPIVLQPLTCHTQPAFSIEDPASWSFSENSKILALSKTLFCERH